MSCNRNKQRRRRRVQRTVLPTPEEDPLKGCINVFEVNQWSCSADDRVVSLSQGDPTYPKWQAKFSFNIVCKISPEQDHWKYLGTHMFFCTRSKKCLIILDSGGSTKKCAITGFWVDNNIPTLSSKWMEKQDEIMGKIADDFKDQYASVLLDNLINSE